MIKSIKGSLKSLARSVITRSKTAYGRYRLGRARPDLFCEQPRRADKPVVYSIVSNTAVFDSRVMKQARTLRDAGYDVKLYCAHDDNLPVTHVVDGIEFRRFRPFDASFKLSDTERAVVLRLFGEDRTVVDEHAFFVGSLGGDVEMLRAEAKVVLSRLTKTASDNPERADLESRYEQIKQRVREILATRRGQIVARKAYLYIYYFATNFLALKFPEVPQFIHSHDIYPLPGAIELARRTGAKVIFDAHEIETERMPGFAPPEKAFVDRVERLWMSQIDAMVVCCDSAADFYGERFTKHRPQVVMNAPEMLPEHISDFDLRATCKLTTDQPLIIYTGGIGREPRGLHLVVQALQYLPAYHLAVLGPRHALNDGWLKDCAQVAGVAQRVHLLSPVASDRVVAATRSADLGVCPIQDASLSYRFAMPNKLFEMAFAGVPLCVSNLPEMARFVLENSVGITMDETDPVDIARALRETYAHRDRLRQNPTQLRQLIEKYAWPVQAAKLLQVYKSMEDTNVRSVSTLA